MSAVESVRPAVRHAQRDEADVIAALHRRAAVAGYGHIFPPEAPPPTEEALTDKWQQWLGADSEWCAFVAVNAADVVGVVLAGMDPDDLTRGHLARLYVAPELWGRGIGRQLYEAAVGHVQEREFTALTLWVLEENHRARSWYERLGWRPNGTRKTSYAPTGVEDLGYELTLR